MMDQGLQTELPLYWQDKWLDLVAGQGNWKRIDLIDNNHLIGSWVYQLKIKAGFSVISMPALTAYSGPWINPEFIPHDTYKKGVYLKEKLEYLANKLPKSTVLFQQLIPGFEAEMALNWLGFKLAYRYTFFVSRTIHFKQLEADSGWKARSHLRIAASLTKVRVAPGFESFRQYYAHHFPNSQVSKVITVLKALIESQTATILELTDESGKCQGICVLVWDQHTTYLLFALRNPVANIPNAMQVLIWESIRQSLQAGRNFDFEGSIHPNIFASFSRYGAEMKKHAIIWKTANPLIDFAADLLKKGIYQL